MEEARDPDHTWDQSRTNAVTPTTFLFLETRITDTGQDTVTHAMRSEEKFVLHSRQVFKLHDQL